MKYNITLELLKRVIVPVEALSEEDAHSKINFTLMNDGLDFIKDEVGSITFDSIRVDSVSPTTYDEGNTQLGSTN